jgi:hypothetical protein
MLRGIHARGGAARRATAVLVCTALVTAAACSGDDDSGSGAKSPPTRQVRPAGPAADLSNELTGGKGVFIGSGSRNDLKSAGYVEHEYLAAGTATSYKAQGALSSDGKWSFTPDGTAPYRTRIVVRRPAKAKDFSGNVIVEWLNVSGGLDADPEWASVREEILRRGDAWVGVSAQQIGVIGGPVLVQVSGIPGSELTGKGLKAIDPARYGSLQHPGDGFSFDIMTQVARGLRTGHALGGTKATRVIAAGESQSAFALVTYYNGVQPLTHAFDGFFIHSRGASGMPLVGPGKPADISGAIGKATATFRTDQDAPVLDIQTEGDLTSVLNSYAARQPDSEHFRLWEVAGTAHADVHLVGPGNAKAFDCGVPINNGATHVVAKAALRALVTWVTRGEAPKSAPRLQVTQGASPQIRRNADGIALGGIRTPPVDVPVAALSGAPGPNPAIICILLGSTTPFSAARLAQLYPSRAVYEQRYKEATDAAIDAGYVLRDDRTALLGFAEPDRIAG